MTYFVNRHKQHYGLIIFSFLLVMSLMLVAPDVMAGKGGVKGGSGGGKDGGSDKGGPKSTETIIVGTVYGEAFGAWAEVELLGLLGLTTLTLPATPHVELLTSSDAMDSETLLEVGLSNILSSGTLNSTVVGAVGPDKAGVVSYSEVEGLEILDGLVSASAVLAMCNSRFDAGGASLDMSGSLLADLQVGGISITAFPEPNTVIDLEAARVILNEQVITGPGAGTVNMIRVKILDEGLLSLLGDVLSGDIIIASASCDQDLRIKKNPPDLEPGDGFITGGGRLGDHSGFATFGMNAGTRGGVLKGQLQYNDHLHGMKLHGSVITEFAIEANCAVFSGEGVVNNSAAVDFSVIACDNGEPGKDGVDSFVIGWDGYSSSGVGPMRKGNLQLHQR